MASERRMQRLCATLAWIGIAAVSGPSVALAQQGGPIVPGSTLYTASPIPDEEAVSVSVTGNGFTNPLLTLIDETGVETDCILPCTARSRVGRLTLEGERLSIDVDLQLAGLTYDVNVTPGPSGGDFALVTVLMVTGGAAAGLGIWGLLSLSETDDLYTLAAIGTVYGLIAFGISVPFLIIMLATIDGSGVVSNPRRGLIADARGIGFSF